MIIRHDPPTVYPPAGPYAHGVELRDASRLLFVSGTMGLAPDGAAADDFEAQCEQAWANIGAVLASAGMDWGNLVKVNCFLGDAGDRDVNAAVRARVLGDHRVAVTVVAVTLLDTAWRLEIEAVAAA
jgi:2-iminobutanoate/2-iminopropanoate deaminase